MKRIVAILCLCLLLLLPGCANMAAEAEPAGPVVDGGFRYTPQEFIDIINEAAENDDSGKIIKFGDYVESGESIWLENGSTSVLLKLEENEAGMLDDVRMYWATNFFDLNEQYTVGYYCAQILIAILPDRAEEISEDLSTIFEAGSGTVEYTFDGVHVELMSAQGQNWFDVELAE